MSDESRSHSHEAPRRGVPGRGALALLLGAVLLLLGHLLAVRTLNVNWDEFALFARAHDTLTTGRLQSGGRPGLTTVALMPFARGCASALDALDAARWWWVAFTLGMVTGLWAFVRLLLPGGRSRLYATLAVAGYVAVPDFLRHSVEVRSDQPAISFALWGGVALLASRKRPWLALVGGAALGLGFLFSQKAVYVAALVGLCAAVASLDDLDWRREGIRAVSAVAGGVLVLLAFDAIVPFFLEPPPPLALSNQLNTFDYYRSHVGIVIYLRAAPFYFAHLTVLAVVALATVVGPRRRDLLLIVWGIVALTVVIAAFHTGALPYFVMTLGLFPALVLGLGAPILRERYDRQGSALVPLATLWVLLGVGATVGSARLMRNTQGPQRDAFAFVANNFDPDALGFHTDRAFVCRNDPDPLPVLWGASMVSFRSRDGAADRVAFVDAFRERPVRFLVASTRLREFPQNVQAFWDTRYVRYRAQVMVPGTGLAGRTRGVFEVTVPGRYRWTPEDSAPPVSIGLDGAWLQPGEEVWLDEGLHLVLSTSSRARGWLALALAEPPSKDPDPFYLEF